MDKRKALSIIAKKLEMIQMLTQECVDISDESGVSFSLSLPFDDTLFYTSKKEALSMGTWRSSEANCSWENEYNGWSSSSDNC